MITISDCVKAYTKTNLAPAVTVGISNGYAHPLSVILLSKGLKQDSIYDYFGADYVTEFNRGFYARPQEKSYNIENYNQGKEIREKILSNTLLAS